MTDLSNFTPKGTLECLYYNTHVGFAYLYSTPKCEYFWMRRPREKRQHRFDPQDNQFKKTFQVYLNSRNIRSTASETIRFRSEEEVRALRKDYDCPGLTDMSDEDFEAVMSEWAFCKENGVVPKPKYEKLLREGVET